MTRQNKKLTIKQNSNSHICVNQGNILVTNFHSLGPHSKCYQPLGLRESSSFSELIQPQSRFLTTSLSRAYTLNEIYEKYLAATCQLHEIPTLRLCGFFSALSSIRQQNDISELSTLEKDEKTLLIKYIEQGGHTKIILNLDMDLIMHLSYSPEQYIHRADDLYNTLVRLERYPNLEIVLDYSQNITPLHIFDNLVAFKGDMHSINSQDTTYTHSYITSDIFEINCLIDEYDQKFEELRNNLAFNMGMYHSDTLSQFIRTLSNFWFSFNQNRTP